MRHVPRACRTCSPADGPDTTVPTMLAERRADAETPRTLLVPDEYAGDRLDKVLATIISRILAQPPAGLDRCATRSDRWRAREDPPAGAARRHHHAVPDLLPEQLAFTPEPVPLEIVYEDDALVVINKPAGMVVHPAAGNWSGTLLNGLLYRYGDAAAGLPRAGIVHRLDKETSGLMVVAARSKRRRSPHAAVAGTHGQAPLRRARVGDDARTKALSTHRLAAIRATVRAWRWWRARREFRAYALPHHRPRDVERPARVARFTAISIPAAHIRFACIARISDIRCWAIPSTGHARASVRAAAAEWVQSPGAACLAARTDSSGDGQEIALARRRPGGY